MTDKKISGLPQTKKFTDDSLLPIVEFDNAASHSKSIRAADVARVVSDKAKANLISEITDQQVEDIDDSTLFPVVNNLKAQSINITNLIKKVSEGNGGSLPYTVSTEEPNDTEGKEGDLWFMVDS